MMDFDLFSPIIDHLYRNNSLMDMLGSAVGRLANPKDMSTNHTVQVNHNGNREGTK